VAYAFVKVEVGQVVIDVALFVDVGERVRICGNVSLDMLHKAVLKGSAWVVHEIQRPVVGDLWASRVAAFLHETAPFGGFVEILLALVGLELVHIGVGVDSMDLDEGWIAMALGRQTLKGVWKVVQRWTASR
jgi:hypothetical protein